MDNDLVRSGSTITTSLSAVFRGHGMVEHQHTTQSQYCAGRSHEPISEAGSPGREDDITAQLHRQVAYYSGAFVFNERDMPVLDHCWTTVSPRKATGEAAIARSRLFVRLLHFLRSVATERQTMDTIAELCF